MLDKGVPRLGQKLFFNKLNQNNVNYKDKEIGQVTSGTKSPLLNQFIGMALVKTKNIQTGQFIDIDFNNKRKKAKIVSLPFYRKK